MDVHTFASVVVPTHPPFFSWLISLSYVCPSLCVCVLPSFVSDSFSREIRDAYLVPLSPSSPVPACRRGLILKYHTGSWRQGPHLPGRKHWNKDVHPETVLCSPSGAAGVLPLVAVHSASWRLPAATPARLALLGGASSISTLFSSSAADCQQGSGILRAGFPACRC